MKYLTEKELKKLFKVIHEDHNKYNVRNEAMFKLAYYCASRVSEVGLFEVSDFNPSMNQIYCKRIKSGRNNTLRIIEPDILRSFKRYLRDKEPCPESNILFCSQLGNPIGRKQLDKLMKHYCEQADILDKSKWHFHVLRHTRAIYLAEHGLEVKDIMYWLGHKNISNTMIYFDYTAKQQEVLYKKLSSYADIF